MAKLNSTALVVYMLIWCLQIGSSGAKICEEAVYTEEEKIALAKFRELMKNDLYGEHMQHDEYLVHWLRAKRLDIQQAGEMLKRSLKWRQDEKIDQLAEEPFPQFEKNFRVDTKARDRDGRPVVMVQNGAQWDLRKVALAGQMDNFLRYVTKVYFEVPSRLARQLGQEAGTNCTRFIFLSSIYGYNLRQHGCVRCVPYYLHFITTYERHYPQHMKETVLVNVPEIFSPIVELSKPFWSGHLAQHLYLINSDKNQMNKVLDRFISRDQLPSVFGGTSTRQI